MQDSDKAQREPAGNTGNWYLELLGVEPATDAPKAASPAQTAFIIDDEPQSTSLATPLEDDDEETRQATLELEPATREDEGPEWQPSVATRPPARSGPQFRWWMVIVPAIIAAIVVAAALWLPTTSDAEAREEADDYIAVLADMRATLPDIQQALATATEPASGPIDLLPLSAQLSTLEAAAAEVSARASRDLPDTLPLAPRTPLEDLVPTRERMRTLADRGADIVDRIALTIDYRTTLDGILSYPSLPVRADPSQINVLSGELADVLATSSALASDLPADPAFDAHRERVDATVASFDEWRESFLDALRREDQDEAEALTEDVAALRRELFSAAVPSLAAVRTEVDGEIIQLNEDISDTIRNVPVP